MHFPKKRFYLEVTVLLVACVASSHAEGEPESSTVEYEVGHQLALAAFETASPDHSYLLGDEGPPKIVANELMDIALEKVREMITAANMDRIAIPEFVHDFDRNVAFFKLHGHFKGYDGWVQSLLSIERSGDTSLYVEGTSLVLDAPLRLKTLDLGMNFETDLEGLKVRGNLTGRVASNSVWLSNALDYATGECQLKVRNLEVKDLGKIYVEVAALGEWDWLSSLVATWLTQQTHETIRKAVNTVLLDLLKNEIKKPECPNLALPS